MNNINNYTELLNASPFDDITPPIPAANEDDCELILQHSVHIFDISGSMKDKIEKVYNNFKATLSTLSGIDEESVDIKNVVKVVFFNNETKAFNDVYQEPNKLDYVITAEDFRCSGSTNASSVIEFIDKELSRSNPAIRNLKKNTPGINIFITTDAQCNDPVTLREEAFKRLSSNWFYKNNYARIIVIYIGDDDNHRETAIALAGGKEENVISLTDDLMTKLSNFIVANTVIMPDGTHPTESEEGTSSLSDSANEIVSREQQGQFSADLLSNDDINIMLSKLMGGVM